MSDLSSDAPFCEARMALKHRLREAKKAAWGYLEGFDANDLCTIMEAIEETMVTPQHWEDEEGRSRFELSTLENLKQMGHRVQDFFYNEWQGSISLMDIFATVAYTRAEDGERALISEVLSDETVAAFGNVDLAAYSLAVEACMDAWEALHLGRALEDKQKLETQALQAAEKIEIQRRGKSKGGNATGAYYAKAKAFIIDELKEVLKSGSFTVILPEKGTFRIRFDNGEINAEGCAKYLWSIHDGKVHVNLKKVAEYIREYKKLLSTSTKDLEEKQLADQQARRIRILEKFGKRSIRNEDKSVKPRLWPNRP